LIELHAHLLPGIDDGPQTLEDALALARLFVADGVTHVVATPHVFPGRFDNTLQSNLSALAQFQQALKQADIALSISVAGEVRFSEHVPQLLADGALPFLGEMSDGFRSLLLEMPDGGIPLGAEKLIAWLLERQIRPVIAHPERNRMVRDRPELGRELVKLGCELQLTAGALLGQFGAPAQKASRAMLDAGVVSAVASDAHNLSARAPCLSAAYQWLEAHYGAQAANELTRHGPIRLGGLSRLSSQELATP
jgi:protein-tyrosine phosphatase